VLIRALKKYPFDAMMPNINFYNRFNFPEIAETMIPLAHQKGDVIILMRLVADGLLWKSAAPAFPYALSQDGSVVVAGANNRELLETDLVFAQEFRPMGGYPTNNPGILFGNLLDSSC
jgi:uncharacterized protein